MSIGLITELEVVNSVLSTAGDAPIQSLDDGYQPTYIITQMMNNVSRDIQTMKYWFNTEYDVTLESDYLTNTIVLPYNILHFEPQDTRYVARGLQVYDRETRTNEITTSIVADICTMLPFNELPQVARKYIQALCKLQYNDEYLGEDSIRTTLQREVQRAKTDLDRTHIENEDINILSSSRVNNIAFSNRRRGS